MVLRIRTLFVRAFLFVLLLVGCSKSDPAPVPTISGFTPAAGPESTSVTISGLNFAIQPEHNEVRFNGINAHVTAGNSRELMAIVPTGATSGVITVSVNGQTCVSDIQFIVNPLMGKWRFTGAAATNCTDAIDEGVVPCSFDCPTLTFGISTVIFANSAVSYTYAYTLSATTLSISSASGSFVPGYVINGDRLTLVYPPGDCSVTETYKRI